ncbi:36319_t:CDS:2, partial [Gigaspora margarita]
SNDILANYVSSAGIVFSNKLVKLKGCEFGNRLGIFENDLNEAASVLLETLADERIKLRQLLSQYEPKNIYNADETGLFYQILPNQTLAQQANKSRLTMLLATNATGSHKLMPLIIDKLIKLRSFNRINISQLPVTYKNNEYTWMKSDIWENAPEMPASSDNINSNRDKRPENDELDSEYKDGENFISEGSENDEISNFEGDEDSQSNSQFYRRTHGRTHRRTRESTHGKLVKVLMEVLVEVLVEELIEELVEGRVKDHELKGPLTNIKLYYLPSNMTAYQQSLDAGIIRLFKSKYKNLYCKHVLNQFESNADLKKLEEMEFANQESEDDFLDDKVAEIIVDLSSSDDPKASNIAQIMERYIQIVDKPVATEEILNDEEIITMVQAEENEQESDDDKEPSPPPVIAKKVYSAIQTVL